MVAGFATRTHISANDPEARVLKAQENTRQLSAYAQNSAPSDVGGRSDVDLRPLEVFYSALQHVREDYVEPIQKSQERELTYGALRVMLDSLHDPQTRFLDQEQAQLVAQAREGKFEGIGAALSVGKTKEDGISEERVVVATTIPGSPARKAGLVTGDTITELDGKTVLPYDPFQRIEKLVKATRNGKLSQEKLQKLFDAEQERIKNGIGFQKAMDKLTSSGKDAIALTVVRNGAKAPIKLKIQPAETVVQAATSAKVNASVGYIKVNLLGPDTENIVGQAIKGFKSDGTKSIVLDLRDCPGGTLESAEAVAGDLAPDKRLAILQLPHNKQRTLKTTGVGATAAWQGPISVLVNGGTSGVSEILAAAVRDGANAKLVGSTTFGDSLQQTYLELKDGSAVTFTTGKYLTAKGIDIAGKGLEPDVKSAAPAVADVAPASDPLVAKAVAVMASVRAKG